jgi:hypothetical protein
MKAPPNSYTIHKFCQLSGFDRNAIARRIEEIQAQPSGESSQGASLYHLRDLVRALLGGDIEAERLRKIRGEADLIEHNLAVRRRDYVRTEDVIKLGLWHFTAVREIIWRSPLEERERRAILHELLALKDHDWRKDDPNPGE